MLPRASKGVKGMGCGADPVDWGAGLTKLRLQRDVVCIQLCRCDDEVCGLLVLRD